MCYFNVFTLRYLWQFCKMCLHFFLDQIHFPTGQSKCSLLPFHIYHSGSLDSLLYYEWTKCAVHRQTGLHSNDMFNNEVHLRHKANSRVVFNWVISSTDVNMYNRFAGFLILMLSKRFVVCAFKLALQIMLSVVLLLQMGGTPFGGLGAPNMEQMAAMGLQGANMNPQVSTCSITVIVASCPIRSSLFWHYLPHIFFRLFLQISWSSCSPWTPSKKLHFLLIQNKKSKELKTLFR